jgi:CheY-like chemotaxis protein
LGLASAYGIVKAHGGYIDVESQKGCGSMFSVYLPASQERAETHGKGVNQMIAGSGSTILLVDDEPMVLEVGVQMLEKLGFKVLEAKGGIEACEVYVANKDEIGLVILDMIMPDMSGGEAYDRMKEINPDAKVLLSSGYSINGQATEILERGCNGFIQKPFSIKDLSERIRDI